MRLIERPYIKLGYDLNEDGEVFIQYQPRRWKRIGFCFRFHSFKSVLSRIFGTLKLR